MLTFRKAMICVAALTLLALVGCDVFSPREVGGKGLVLTLLIILWMFSVSEGWLGWLAAFPLALAGGISLLILLVDGDGSLLLFVGVAGILPLPWKICRHIRRVYNDGLDAAGVPRRHRDVDAATPGQAETGSLEDGPRKQGPGPRDRVGE